MFLIKVKDNFRYLFIDFHISLCCPDLYSSTDASPICTELNACQPKELEFHCESVNIFTPLPSADQSSTLPHTSSSKS